MPLHPVRDLCVLGRAVEAAPQIGDLLAVLNGLVAQLFLGKGKLLLKLVFFVFQTLTVLLGAVKLVQKAVLLLAQRVHLPAAGGGFAFEFFLETRLGFRAPAQQVL